MPQTAFFSDERCFWHGGGNYAFTLPVGGLVQPGAGLPESPETKRRLRNLIEVTGLSRQMQMLGADPATEEDLRRVHPASYLSAFKAMSDAGGGELGLRTPFGRGGYEIAALSTGLATAALRHVVTGGARNAYALSRPPGHHCTSDFPNGFCLLNNIAVAIRALTAEKLVDRVAVVDWDVHHGNGTEAIFWDDPNVLTISLHQDRNYPLDTGDLSAMGGESATGANLNLPLPPGCGHAAYLHAMERVVVPALARFKPDAIVVACGFDAAAVDPLGRMLCTAETFRQMTRRMQQAADDLCKGRLTLVHEGGYSEVYVPFCGHAVLEELVSVGDPKPVHAPDPLAATLEKRQPDARFDAFARAWIDDAALALRL